MASGFPGILSFEDARHTVEKHAGGVTSCRSETVSLLEADGRVLSETVVADRDFPPFPRATRDGYAVRSEDVAQLPARVRMVAEIRAGASVTGASIEIRSGEAARIMTGAPVPRGADAVVMVEYTQENGDTVEITRSIAAAENVVAMGSEARRGDVLLEKGSLLSEGGIAIAASVGKVQMQVYGRPTVAVLSTGDEIVDARIQPEPNQIRNSNSYSLAAQIKAAGAKPLLLPIAPDEPRRLRELIQEGLHSDLLLLAGGVSMGKYDLVEQVLTELGAEFFFTGAQIQPGKPIVFGRVRGRYFFGLPGNPVSTMVTFELFARPMIDALRGRKPQSLAFLHARLKSEIKVKMGLTRFLPAMLSGEFERTEVGLVKWQGSGDIAATLRANCYVVVPPDRERIRAGEWVAVIRK
jgi:molybdopterin molybdotransferase